MKAGHAISAAPATAPVIASAECAELPAPLMLSAAHVVELRPTETTAMQCCPKTVAYDYSVDRLLR